MEARDPPCVCVCVCIIVSKHTCSNTHTNIWLHAISAPWTREWNEHISSSHWAASHPYRVIPAFSVSSTVRPPYWMLMRFSRSSWHICTSPSTSRRRHAITSLHGGFYFLFFLPILHISTIIIASTLEAAFQLYVQIKDNSFLLLCH